MVWSGIDSWTFRVLENISLKYETQINERNLSVDHLLTVNEIVVPISVSRKLFLEKSRRNSIVFKAIHTLTRHK